MIKFFRGIRQRLIGESRFSKYLLYAIGEILLVVIGILIALQINNWNQDRLSRAEELRILKALKTGLEKDRDDLLFNEGSISSSISSADKVIYALEHNVPYRDSIADYLGDVMLPVLFVNSTSAFETLKSKGIDLIRDPELRDQIIEVYDSGYNFFLKYEGMVSDEAERGVREVFPTRFEEGYSYDLEQPNYRPRLVPLNYEALKSDQPFKYYLKTYRNRLDILLQYHYRMKLQRSVEALLADIQKEIERQEK